MAYLFQRSIFSTELKANSGKMVKTEKLIIRLNLFIVIKKNVLCFEIINVKFVSVKFLSGSMIF